jgi:hypothetical protein
MHFVGRMTPPRPSAIQRVARVRAASLRSRSAIRACLDASIFDLLLADHHALTGLFEELKAELDADAPTAAACRELLHEIDALLTPHARAEEEIAYPAFAASADDAERTEAAVAAAYEEHALARRLLGELKARPQVDRGWCAKAKVLMRLFERHMRAEEAEQFPGARKALSARQSLVLAAEFLAAKERTAKELGLRAAEPLGLRVSALHAVAA